MLYEGFFLLARRQQHRRALLLAAVTTLTLLAFGLALYLTHRPPAAAAPAAVMTGYSAFSEENTLVIRGYDGRLLLRTQIDTRALPAADRAALEDGVPLADAHALSRLLEDYGS